MEFPGHFSVEINRLADTEIASGCRHAAALYYPHINPHCRQIIHDRYFIGLSDK
ncbi:hypothetical protein SAMN02746095_00409 [Acidocella aminolytica 101 = DSM 11237]|nr:hypothetical protein SAMN02746095_00409 [Acidocella aminolytica 101 = DSM 11237]